MGMCHPDNYLCPYTGFKKPCVKLRATCPKWIHIKGLHPQTGQEIDCFDCADQWQSVLAIEGAQQSRQAAAATESLRNHMVEGIDKMVAAAAVARQINHSPLQRRAPVGVDPAGHPTLIDDASFHGESVIP